MIEIENISENSETLQAINAEPTNFEVVEQPTEEVTEEKPKRKEKAKKKKKQDAEPPAEKQTSTPPQQEPPKTQSSLFPQETAISKYGFIHISAKVRDLIGVKGKDAPATIESYDDTTGTLTIRVTLPEK